MTKKHYKADTAGDSDSASPADPTEALAPVEPSPLTPAQIAELQERAAKADEHWDRFLRLTADFENFKKRAARERQDAIKFANEGLILKLIPVTDNFEMALAATKNSADPAAQSLQAGIAMIQQQLRSVLNDAGLEDVDAAGKPFDPTLHEAVSHQESTDLPDGHVLQQLRKGYKLQGRLLRPATVVVAKKPAENSK